MRAIMRVMLIMLLGTVMGACQRGFHCVVAGAQVATPVGPRVIETLEVGDAVMARIPDGSITTARVTAKSSHRVTEHLQIVLDDGRVLRVTAEHPVAVEGGEFIRAGDLKAERVLITREGVTRVREVRREGGVVEVFDLSVSPGETFFAEGVLVHNKSFAAPPTFETMSGSWLYVGGLDQPTFRMDVRSDGAFSLRDQWSGQTWEGRLPANYDGKSLDFGAYRVSRPVRLALTPVGGTNGMPARMDVTITWGVMSGEVAWLWRKPRRDAVHLVHERTFAEVLKLTNDREAR